MIFRRVIILVVGVLLSACRGEKEFKIEGTVEGAKDAALVVEKADAGGRWVPIDSVRTTGNGSFSLALASPAAPEIYRLAYQGNYLYFPIDSEETVKVSTSAADFANATLTGSANAELLSRFEKALRALPANADAATLDNFKRQVYVEYIAPGKGSIVSYYVLTKTRDGKPLFDAENGSDAKYFSAVATAYQQYKPNDPRTKMLEEIALKGQRAAASAAGRQRVVHAQELTFIEVEFPDIEGNNRKLSSLLGNGKPTVLIFTLLTAEGSPEYNAEIRKIYNSGRADIYMVGLDPDRIDWREAARNLPWVNVFASEGSNSKTLLDYNVTAVPTAFIFDSKGNLVQREDNPSLIATHF